MMIETSGPAQYPPKGITNMQKTTNNDNDIKILMICKAAFFTKNHLLTLNILCKPYKFQSELNK